jgi:hypothetical protein
LAGKGAVLDNEAMEKIFKEAFEDFKTKLTKEQVVFFSSHKKIIRNPSFRYDAFDSLIQKVPQWNVIADHYQEQIQAEKIWGNPNRIKCDSFLWVFTTYLETKTVETNLSRHSPLECKWYKDDGESFKDGGP